MKSEINELLRDLRAAVFLGKAEAVNIALDKMGLLPGISSNDPLNEYMFVEVVSPIGEMLSRLPSTFLQPLLVHPLAAGRAVGAAAFARHHMKNIESSKKEILTLANDSRPDVRNALAKTFINLFEVNPEQILILGTNWIQHPSPKIKQTALIFLPVLAETKIDQIMDLLKPLISVENEAVRSGLADALGEIGKTLQAVAVLRLLSEWSSQDNPNTWVICRTLSKSWAAGYSSEVKSILLDVKSKTKDAKPITNTLKALKRHGVDISL